MKEVKSELIHYHEIFTLQGDGSYATWYSVRRPSGGFGPCRQTLYEAVEASKEPSPDSIPFPRLETHREDE